MLWLQAAESHLSGAGFWVLGAQVGVDILGLGFRGTFRVLGFWVLGLGVLGVEFRGV